MTTVLVVDDNAEHCELVRRVLGARGYDVAVAPDAESGLDAAGRLELDMILLDMGLPDVDGQTLVGLFRRMPGLDKVPIVAVTAWPQETARRMVEVYGCNGYIGKPIRVADFASQIAEYLRRS